MQGQILKMIMRDRERKICIGHFLDNLTPNYFHYNWSEDGPICKGGKPIKLGGSLPVHNELESANGLDAYLKRHVHPEEISPNSNPLCTPNNHL